MEIRSYRPSDEDAVIALWREAGLLRPWNDPKRDIERKLTEQPELFLVCETGGKLAGTAMVGYDGHRGWVYYLAVAESQRGRAMGTALMQRAEQLLIERGCPKLSLMVRSSNAAVLKFYESLGYARDEVVTLGRRLIPD
ncbi:GNAT family acetyltransferase [Candidimonas humi]|uniref:GNAT family acetyltransferase n=1 Tax=Candidimonas humi TaxID=683355 RepID=A0ABV8NXL0_9BURK|nr:GNAT family acetyltransferase [Candidimonas humi]MBV6305807.1 GNAT family acetyltransferase [Candidimonas humi]